MLALHKNSPAPAPAPAAPAAPVATTPTPTPVVITAPKPTPAPRPVSAPAGSLDQVRAIWAFDQSSGNTIIDSSGNGYNATLVGDSATWVKGSGLRLSNSNYVEVAGAVVNTAQSFTVMARVSLDVIEAKKYQCFVSIDAKEMGGFDLQFNPFAGQGAGRFEFARLETDNKNATKIPVKAKTAISTNIWYHLTGVYDADAQELSLYLDGKFQESAPFTNGWQATGKTAIGRGQNNGRNANFLNGTIRDVRIYSSALTAEQIKKLAK